MRIVVYGNPAPQGSKKFAGMRGGHGVLVESSKKVKPWRMDVKAAAQEAIERRLDELNHHIRGWQPYDIPLSVLMVFTLPKPASAPKTRTIFPMRMPDCSKLVRSTEDALTDAGVWVDDARIVECISRKVYPGEDPYALATPGAIIDVYPFGVRIDPNLRAYEDCSNVIRENRTRKVR